MDDIRQPLCGHCTFMVEPQLRDDGIYGICQRTGREVRRTDTCPLDGGDQQKAAWILDPRDGRIVRRTE